MYLIINTSVRFVGGGGGLEGVNPLVPLNLPKFILTGLVKTTSKIHCCLSGFTTNRALSYYYLSMLFWTIIKFLVKFKRRPSCGIRAVCNPEILFRKKLSLTSCTDSYIGLTSAIGWGSRSVLSSSNSSMGWPPGTSPTTASRCQYRPLAPPCVHPGYSVFYSSSLERELRQSALVASSTLRPPFGTRSLTICAILNSPLVFLGTGWEPSFSPKFDATHFLI